MFRNVMLSVKCHAQDTSTCGEPIRVVGTATSAAAVTPVDATRSIIFAQWALLILLLLCAPGMVKAASSPYTGTPIAVPGSFEAENYDLGGEGVAYRDNTKGNQGGQYRPKDNVDIIVSTDLLGGGYVVNNFESGEWLAYTINVASSGQYDIMLRASTTLSNSAVHIEIDGKNVTGSLTLPNTGSWSAFQWAGKQSVALTAGKHVLKIVADRQYFNLNSIKITKSVVPTPFTGTPISLPGSFEAENFDLGGEGVAYHDNTKGNQGGLYRLAEDVDIVTSTDALGGGYVVSNIETGEWLAYTVNVASSGLYNIELRTSSLMPNSAFHVEIDGVNVTGSVIVPATGAWNAFQWIGKQNVSLTAGTHILKIVADQQYFNLNAVRVTAKPVSSPFTGTPIPVPGTFEAENFDLGGEGAGYHDTTTGNQGGQYRLSENVDITVSTDSAGGGYVVNNFTTGEWLAYTINVATSGQYDIMLRVSSALANSAFHVEVDGTDVTGRVTVPTGDWNTFTWVGKTGVTLSAGIHVLKVVADQQYFNLNSISVTAPAAAPPVGGGSGATLLFSSGFEGSTALSAPTNCYTTGCWQNISGVDSATGFAWPPNVWGGSNARFQLISSENSDASTIGNYMVNQIQTVTGRKGTPTRAMYSEIKKGVCCGLNPPQNPLILQPTSETGDLYISYWLKYQPNYAQLMPSPSWRVLFEFKTAGDYRVIAQVVTWGIGAPLSWQIIGDNEANGGLAYQKFWEIYNTTAPVPIDQWFKFEVFWHRSSGSDGRVWMAINGQVIADRYGPNKGVNNAPINRIMMPNLYTGGTYSAYQWLDDIQIWNGFPPVGNDPPYAPH